MRRFMGFASTVVVVASLALDLPKTAAADPLPGFDLDPAELGARMTACVAYEVGEQEILMGWVNLRTRTSSDWPLGSGTGIIRSRRC